MEGILGILFKVTFSAILCLIDYDYLVEDI